MRGIGRCTAFTSIPLASHQWLIFFEKELDTKHWIQCLFFHGFRYLDTPKKPSMLSGGESSSVGNHPAIWQDVPSSIVAGMVRLASSLVYPFVFSGGSSLRV